MALSCLGRQDGFPARAVAAAEKDRAIPLEPGRVVVRVRDGQIVESRDYGDHVGLARAFDRLEGLAGALLAATDRPASTATPSESADPRT